MARGFSTEPALLSTDTFSAPGPRYVSPMPFDPELQARIDKLRGRTSDTEEDQLRRKLDKRSGQPGYAANAAEIGQRLQEMGGGPEESEDGDHQ